MGPYAYKGDQWVSFDDAGMINHKSNYIKNMNLGGAMIWALDLDDCRYSSVISLVQRVFSKAIH